MERCLLAFLLSGVILMVQGHTNTTTGVIHGSRVEGLTNVSQYLGIPYAEPPIGDLRFRPPVLKTFIPGVFDAYNNTKICPQPGAAPNLEQTEDCLRLDMYKHRSIDRDNLGPVMIYFNIYGYKTGSTHELNAAWLAYEGEMIVILANVRLGILGYLNTMDGNAVGNLGLMDQCLVLDWVVRNIGGFGGDVNRITIFGDEAGGSSVMQLAMSSLCPDKFQRVISQTGIASVSWTHNHDPLDSAMKLATVSGCGKESKALVDCLRSKTLDELIHYQMEMEEFGVHHWAPYYSRDLFPDNPIDIIHGRHSPGLMRFRSKDFMTGVNNEDGEAALLFDIASHNHKPVTVLTDQDVLVTEEMYQTKLNTTFKDWLELDDYEWDRIYRTLRNFYDTWGMMSDPYAHTRSLIRLYSDMGYVYDAVHVARIHSDKMMSNPTGGGSTYFYQFVPKPTFIPRRPWTDGATIGDSVTYIFNFVQFYSQNDKEKELATRMVRYWTNFAKTGNPNSPEPVVPYWPTYDRESQQYMRLDLTSAVSMRPYEKRIAFWEDVYSHRLMEIREARDNQHQHTTIYPSSAPALSMASVFVPVFATIAEIMNRFKLF